MTEPRNIGDFEIVREVGRGGMGIVYEARQGSLGRRVALKVLPRFADDPVVIQRFHREASSAAALSHPGIVQVFEAGEVDGVHYIAMEFVDGTDLARHMVRLTRRCDDTEADGATMFVGVDEITGQAHEEVEGRPTAVGCPLASWGPEFRKAVGWIEDAARALHAAHEAGVIHRDVKPQNLMIDTSDNVKVADFGIARNVSAGATLTATGEAVGTPAYMSPEQLMNRPADARTDVYSLGVTLYEILTGRRPFEADSAQAIVRMVLDREPRAPRATNPRIPRDLETICLHAMEKEPDRRYQSSAEFADDIRRFLDREPITARPIGPVTRFVRLCMRRRLITGLAAAVVLAAVVVAWLVIDIREREHREAHAAAAEATSRGVMAAVYGHGACAVGEYDDALDRDGDYHLARALRAMEILLGTPGAEAARADVEALPADDSLRPFLKKLLDGMPAPHAALPPIPATDDPAVLEALAIYHARIGRRVEALELFENARDIDPKRLSALAGIGYVAFRLGRHETAQATYRALVPLAPEDPLPKLMLIYGLFREARGAEPRHRLRLLREARGLGAELHDLLGKTPVSTLACAAIDSMLRPEDDDYVHDARMCVQHALDSQKDVNAADSPIPPALFHEIIALALEPTDADEARAHAALALGIEPDNETAALVIGRFEESFGGGFDRYRAVLALTWDTPEIIGRALKQPTTEALGVAAVDLADRMSRILPDDPALTREAGLRLQAAGRNDAARRALAHAWRRYRELGDPEAAEALERRAAPLEIR